METRYYETQEINIPPIARRWWLNVWRRGTNHNTLAMPTRPLFN